MASYTEDEVQRTAQDLIEKHGANAGRVASLCLVDVRRSSDQEIISWWRDVGNAIGAIQGSAKS